MRILIVGGGLSGICVSAALRRKGIAHDVTEAGFPFTGTRASSGILNPIMGQKRNLVGNYDLLFSKCVELYSYLEELLGGRFFHPARILEYLGSAEEQHFFEERATIHNTFLHTQTGGDKESTSSFFQSASSGWGITEKAFILDANQLQIAYLDLLKKEGHLIEKAFSYAAIPSFPLEWEGKNYTHLIYCSGKSVLSNSLNSFLPLSVNKGQALLLDIKTDLARNLIFKFRKKFTLCPWGEKYWWAGASFEWKYETEAPTSDYLYNLEARLQQFLKIPFQIVQPLTGFRVSSSDRTAIAGWLPQNPAVGLLTATGTKGVLQVPAAAAELVENLLQPATKTLFPLNRLLTQKK